MFRCALVDITIAIGYVNGANNVKKPLENKVVKSY